MSENLPALRQAMRVPVKAPENDLFYTPVFRFAFVHLDEPWAGTGRDDGKNTPAFSAVAVFDDDADLSSLVRPTNERLVRKHGPNALELVKIGAMRYPLRPKMIMQQRFAGFEGNGVFGSLRAREDARPACMAWLDGGFQKLQPGAIERHIYSGAYGYAAVQIYAYDNIGKGVAWGMRTLVKIADGERFGGPKPTTQEEALAAVTGIHLPSGLLLPGASAPAMEGRASGKAAPPWQATVPQVIPRGEDDLSDFLNN